MHEARFYERRPDGRVLCTLCPHDCLIPQGGRGACAVRYNESGTLYTLVYDKVVARTIEPVEKKPFFHFYPGSHAYSVATVGCNLRCTFCQNWEISQWPKDHLPKRIEAGEERPQPLVCPQLARLDRSIPGEAVTPRELVDAAERAGCTSVAYTYTEPTIFYELAYDTAKLARERGLKNLFVSNGFISEAPLRQVAEVLDGVNVDLKFFQDASYRRISRARLAPVLEAIQRYRELGVWVEVTTLIIPGVNDSDEELSRIASFLVAVDPVIPWHLSQYYPAYRMRDHPPTPVATLRRAREIGRENGLRYVYEGNVPGEQGENTYCWNCQTLLIDRIGLHIRWNRVRGDADGGGHCPDCNAAVDGVGMSAGITGSSVPP